jgi:RNA polymerase sigma factor (TIGR02999 family)
MLPAAEERFLRSDALLIRGFQPSRSGGDFRASRHADTLLGRPSGNGGWGPGTWRMGDVTRILADIERGDKRAAGQLLPLVYNELRKLAAARLAHEAPGQSLQATALVHEAYLRLVGTDPAKPFDGSGHFFAAAAEAMRRILIDRARDRRRLKRGGGRCRVRIDLDTLLVEPPGEDLLALDEALTSLAREDPGAAELVKLRAFAGLTLAQAADALRIGRRTADRDWAYARAWLCHALAETDPTGEGRKNSADHGAPGP